MRESDGVPFGISFCPALCCNRFLWRLDADMLALISILSEGREKSPQDPYLLVLADNDGREP